MVVQIQLESNRESGTLFLEMQLNSLESVSSVYIFDSRSIGECNDLCTACHLCPKPLEFYTV